MFDDRSDPRPRTAPDDESDLLLAEELDQMAWLKDAVGNTRFIGGLFVTVGVFALILVGGVATPSAYAVAVVSALLVAPGVLYVLAGLFLVRRQYWAWVATAAMTGLLLAAVAVLAVLAIAGGLASGQFAGVLTALIGFGCWAAALLLILTGLRRCVPAVRRTRQLDRPAFDVLPTANPGPGGARPVLPAGEHTPSGR